MRRIPIYSYISTASLMIRGRYGSMAIDRTEYQIYLDKFFSNADDISNAVCGIEKEIGKLERYYRNISGKNYELNISGPIYDTYLNRMGKEEEFSIAESLYRIIEFYLRFLSLMKAITKDEEMECMLPLSA